ncbi:MAG: hypothetical protein ACK5JL_07335 [Candidatus Kapaibacterium sp.]|jgi:hypothetical protein
MKTRFVIAFGCAFGLGVCLSLQAIAQQTGNAAPGTSPIDVPDIIVKGSATLRLMTTSFLKQRPAQTRLLNQSELDTLNPKEKHEVLALPSSAPPQQIPLPSRYNGFVFGSFGMFQTPEFGASLSGSLFNYDVTATADYLSTAGYKQATDMQRFDVRLFGRQAFRQTQEKGTNAESHPASGPLNSDVHDWSIAASSMNYALFAQPDSALKRTRSAVSLQTSFEHTIGGATLRSEVSAIATMLEEGRTGFTLQSENGLRAFAEWKQPDDGSNHSTNYSVSAQIDLRSFRSELLSDNYVRYDYSVHTGSLLLRSSAGLRGGNGSGGSSTLNIIGSVDVSLRSSAALRWGALLSRDVHNSFFTDALNANPYVRSDADLRFTRRSVAGEVYMVYRPDRSLSAQARAGYEVYGALSIPVFDSVSAFHLAYASATRSFVTLQSEWLTDELTSLVARLQWQDVREDAGKTVPYRPATTAELRYRSRISQSWTLEFGVTFVSQRTVSASAQASDNLDGYLYVDGRVDYAVTDALSAFASVQNLTNSSIFVFERYVERSAFGALGLRWKF